MYDLTRYTYEDLQELIRLLEAEQADLLHVADAELTRRDEHWVAAEGAVEIMGSWRCKCGGRNSTVGSPNETEGFFISDAFVEQVLEQECPDIERIWTFLFEHPRVVRALRCLECGKVLEDHTEPGAAMKALRACGYGPDPDDGPEEEDGTPRFILDTLEPAKGLLDTDRAEEV